MKKLITTSASYSFLIFTLLFSYTASAQEGKTSEQNVDQAARELKDAQVNYEAEVARFKVESETRIEENKRRIEALKSGIATQDAKSKSSDARQIEELKEKNEKLKEKLDSFKPESRSNWDNFKKEFNYDMDELGKALKGLTTNNK